MGGLTKEKTLNRALGRLFHRYWRNQRGNVAAMAALLIVPLVGLFALGGEVSTWYTMNRSLQNASDAAAIAAATNGDYTHQDSGGLYMYQREANAVAARYGYTSGSNSAVVTPTTVPCPDDATKTCFQVTISRTVPLLLTRIMSGFGFTGNANNGDAQLLSAMAIATSAGGGTTTFCITALGGTVTSGIQVNGGPKSNLSGCSIASNGDATCNGSDLNADSGYAYYADNNCGKVTNSNHGTKFTDDLDYNRYTTSARSSDVSPCGGTFGQESNNKQTKLSGGTYALSALPGSKISASGNTVYCGDVQLTGNVTITNAGTGALVIENGQIDMNGNNLTVNNTAVVFSGTNSFTATHIVDDNSHPGNKSVLTISPPASGPFQGVAMYQDPLLVPTSSPTGLDYAAAGNGPTWNISGMVYLPNSNVTIAGAINKDGVGACFGLVVNTISISGTGYIIDHGCNGTGTTLPGIATGIKVALVQ